LAHEILTLKSVVKRFGGLTVVNDVSLSIHKGGMFGLMGPNGSGKTTLFNIICGLYKPDRGKIFFDGTRIDGLKPHKVFDLGLTRTFQIPRILQRLTVLDNLLIASEGNPGEGLLGLFLRRGAWRRFEREKEMEAKEVLDLLGLKEYADRRACELSGGQMKLLEIARALMTRPKVILLDEPTAGINPVLATKIYKKIGEIRDELHVTFFIIEHRANLLLRNVDWVYVMCRGRIVAEGEPHDVIKDPVVKETYLGG